VLASAVSNGTAGSNNNAPATAQGWTLDANGQWSGFTEGIGRGSRYIIRLKPGSNRAWEVVAQNEDDTETPLVALGDGDAPQVSINGADITLDASKLGQYAFLDGDLVYSERSGSLITGTRLTGENQGNFEVEFRGTSATNPDIRQVNFSTSEPLVASGSDYRIVQPDAQGRSTTIDVAPIIRNIDGVDVIVGASRFVGIVQGGTRISETYTEVETQAFTGNQITTTDVKLYTNHQRLRPDPHFHCRQDL
jgi:hypothetical protein